MRRAGLAAFPDPPGALPPLASRKFPTGSSNEHQSLKRAVSAGESVGTGAVSAVARARRGGLQCTHAVQRATTLSPGAG